MREWRLSCLVPFIGIIHMLRWVHFDKVMKEGHGTGLYFLQQSNLNGSIISLEIAILFLIITLNVNKYLRVISIVSMIFCIIFAVLNLYASMPLKYIAIVLTYNNYLRCFTPWLCVIIILYYICCIKVKSL